MEISLLEKSYERVRLLLKGAPLALVNAIRRACFTEVPVMAVDAVEFEENNTVLYDEIIAHRIGLIPLKSEKAVEKYKSPEECYEADFGDPDCYVSLRLDVETRENEQRIVYSGELESLDPDVEPVYKDIPIVVMAPRQKLRLTAYARLGYGKEHAKWMPATIAAHRYLPILRINGEMSSECKKCLEETASFLKNKLEEIKHEVEILEDVNTSGIYWCVKNKCKEDPVELVYNEDRLILTVESAGQLSAPRIVALATSAVKKKVEELLREVREIEKA